MTTPQLRQPLDKAAVCLLQGDASLSYRIPALVEHRGELLLFADERPRPRPHDAWEGTGGAMADDIPNPNRLVWAHLPRWEDGTAHPAGRPEGHLAGPEVAHSAGQQPEGHVAGPEVARPAGEPEAHPTGHPEAQARPSVSNTENPHTTSQFPLIPAPLEGAPRVCGDAAVVSDGTNLSLLYVSSEEIGYFGSTHRGPRLELWHAFGPHPTQLTHRRLGEVYELTGADAIFATSGSGALVGNIGSPIDGCAAFPLVIRHGERASVRILYLRGTQVAALSEPLESPLALDESTILVTPSGRFVTSCRVQNRPGRVTFTSSDGIRWKESALFAPLRPEVPEVPDPGCNAALALIGGTVALLHPHAPGDIYHRRSGALVDEHGQVLVRCSDAEFGYSDLVHLDGRLVVVFERAGGIWGSAVAVAPRLTLAHHRRAGNKSP